MKKVLIIALLGFVFTGCKNIEKLGPGNEMALENQANLESNVVRQLSNFEKLAEAAGWDEEDQKIFAEQKAVILEQLTINYAWLLVIKEAVEENDVNPGLFVQIIDRLPGWIEDGKKIYDLIEEMSRKEE